MSGQIMSERLVAFPASIVGGDGRRLKIGSHVRFQHNGEDRQGEVVGWAGPRRGVEVHLDVDPFLVAVPPVELLRVDEPLAAPITVGWSIVDDVDTSVLLLVPLGGRDMQWISNVEDADRDQFPIENASTARSQPNIRAWSRAVLGRVASLDEDQAALLIGRHIDFPILRRVLNESSLPSEVRKLVFIVTDQDPAQVGDTVDVAEVANLWLRHSGHLDDSDLATRRPILEVGDPIVVTRQPHILDAVYHQVGARIAESGVGSDRVVSVVAGGTPAITYGILLAASTVFGPEAVVSIQPPQDLIVDGRAVSQPLIELRLSETVLVPEGD